jgi:hypothetical protein
MAQVDSIQQMEAARADRYWDALACGCDGRTFGACYLLGYAVEMALKTAYFRFLGVPTRADLRPHLLSQAVSVYFRGRQRRLHDLVAWAELLILTRIQRGRPLDSMVASGLLTHVGEVALNWSEVMRYRRAIDAESEAVIVFRGEEWVHAHYDQLWR